MAKLKLALACDDYDRTRPLLDGSVKPEGIELLRSRLPPADTFNRMLRHLEFDVSEMSMSFYIALRAAGRAPFTAIPVFPMRMFFHTKLLCGEESGVRDPSDLKGKRIGLQEYGITLALWVRAILEHEFSVRTTEVEWVLERPAGQSLGEIIGLRIPRGVKISQVPPGSDLVSMLLDGDVDCAYPYTSMFRGSSMDRGAWTETRLARKVRPLFPDPKAEGSRYFRKTGLFPINHVIVIKNQTLEKSPWIAPSLFEAFQKAKTESYEQTSSLAKRPTNFIWLDSLMEEVKNILGEDPFPYGIKKNRAIIDAMAAYSHEQGLSPRRVGVDELFPSITHET